MKRTSGTYFNDIVKGKNMMTPDVLGYYEIPSGGVAELTEGTYFNHKPIFGVTIVRHGKHDHTASKMFWNKDEALTYIECL